MKRTSHVDDPISDNDSEKLQRLLEFDDTNFVRQAKLCGLDPATDFQNLDLADVDFSNCDLRGFNFSGADLRGTVGVNVTWELGDPILDNADTSESLFTHELEQQKYFQQHPDDLALVERLSTDYWANAIVTVDNLLHSRGDKTRSAMIAFAVFAKHKDPSARTNILLVMRSVLENSNAHKNFVSNILARSWNDTSLSLSCLRAMIAAYGTSRDTLNWLLKYLDHPDKGIQKTVFFALIGSTKFQSVFNDLRSYVRSCDDVVQRRAFVGKSTEMIGQGARSALYNFRDRNFFDFREILDRKLLIETWNPREFVHFMEITDPGAKPLSWEYFSNEGRFDAEILEAKKIQEAKLARVQVAFLALRLDAIRKFGQRTEIYLRYDNGSKIAELGHNDEL